MTDALERLAAAVPANVRAVCKTLAQAGFQAVTVGGAVRDALLERTPGDWDIATSATPDQVTPLFRHVIPTGIQHGTVTVVTGKGVHGHVEVTTFRGEGAYTDARRPDSVVFGVPLIEDFARRDLVVNAIAYDVERGEIIDPFGGRDDIANRVLRAVGDPVARFTEDGLRVMRAVRFAAQLEFALDPATEAAIAPALPSLAKVSRERVADELRKILAARKPSRALAPALRTGIIATVLPELAARLTDDVARRGWLDVIDRVVSPEVRLGAVFAPFATPTADPRRADTACAREVRARAVSLKLSTHEADLAARLASVARAAGEPTWSPIETRRLLAEIERERRPAAVELWQAEQGDALVGQATQALAANVPLAVGDLAIDGKTLMAELALAPGPAIGKLLAALLDAVIVDPSLNDPAQLLARARQPAPTDT